MREEFTLQFRFKGDRKYVHGTDIYNALHDHLSVNQDKIDSIDMSFHKISTQNMIGYIYRNEQVFRNPNTAVFFSCQSSGEIVKIMLKENGENIVERYPYDENKIGIGADFNQDKKEIALLGRLEFTDVEIFVALNKLLLNKLYPSVDGKWYFTRIQLNQFNKHTDYGKIEIKFVNNFNMNLAKSSIHIDNKQVGAIYFSLVK